MERLVIRTDTIVLSAALKLARLVDTGGEAKVLVQQGRVRVNGQQETRRGRKLVPGDRIEVAGRGSVSVAREER